MLTITQINIIKINIYLGIKLYDLYLFFYFILNLIKYILRHNIKLIVEYIYIYIYIYIYRERERERERERM